MAGARIEIEFDDVQVLEALQRAQAQLGTEGLRPLLEEIGEYLLAATRERAAGEVSPDGIPWAALSPRYAKRKAKLRPGLPKLKFDYHMLGDQLAWQVGQDEVLVGTSAVYGARQQFGGGGIPPRPWLGVSPVDAEQIKALTIAFLRQAMGEETPPA